MAIGRRFFFVPILAIAPLVAIADASKVAHQLSSLHGPSVVEAEAKVGEEVTITLSNPMGTAYDWVYFGELSQDDATPIPSTYTFTKKEEDGNEEKFDKEENTQVSYDGNNRFYPHKKKNHSGEHSGCHPRNRRHHHHPKGHKHHVKKGFFGGQMNEEAKSGDNYADETNNKGEKDADGVAGKKADGSDDSFFNRRYQKSHRYFQSENSQGENDFDNGGEGAEKKNYTDKQFSDQKNHGFDKEDDFESHRKVQNAAINAATDVINSNNVYPVMRGGAPMRKGGMEKRTFNIPAVQKTGDYLHFFAFASGKQKPVFRVVRVHVSL